MHGGQVGVAGIAVAHQGSGELFEHSAGVDVIGAASADVHEGQVLGAGDVDPGQFPGGAPGGLIGVQDRCGGQQGPHVGQEPGLQARGRAAADTGEEPVETVIPVSALNRAAARPTGR